MMISEDEDLSSIMLHVSDFPPYYQDFIHPNDYGLLDAPINEKIFNRKRFHNRLLMRHCFKIAENSYTPLTFVIDTGSPMYLYLCPKAKLALGHIIMEDECQTQFIVVNGKKFLVDDTPLVHKNVNIIGLMAIEVFSLHISNIYPEGYEFENLPEYF